ncbi:agmatine/peptidylarginine deiminase [Kitasatospora sp. MAP12-15]|nr:agmatine/peptidylarginine deiminase [Kitasatospora sp. MAP12-44]
MGIANPSRRSLLQFGATALPLMALGATLGATLPGTARAADGPTTAKLRMPAETDPHSVTYLAWPEPTAAWGNQLPAVRRDIANLARQISLYEPVVLVVSPAQVPSAQYLCDTSDLGGSQGITFLQIPNDDLWIRDFGPTFLAGPGAIAGVDTNFNGWGKTGTPYYQAFANDAQVAATLLARSGITRIQAPFTGEGGALETDGQGTLLATVSSLVNSNRNPGMSQDQVEQALRGTLGMDKVIWLAGLAGRTSRTTTSTAWPASPRPAG